MYIGGFMMKIQNWKSQWGFLVVCLFLGVMAELAFLHGKSGISYPVFMALFYSTFLWRFRKYPFNHPRIGYLLMGCISLLAVSFAIYTNPLFYLLNLMIIPGLIVVHLVLITSPKWMNWDRWSFLLLILAKLREAMKYDIRFFSIMGKKLKKGKDDTNLQLIRRITCGLLISVPFLFIIIVLLGSADVQFANLIGRIPGSIFSGNLLEIEFRTFTVIIYTMMIFGFLQVLRRKRMIVRDQAVKIAATWDGVMILPILILMNVIYVLFTIVQFKYFFSGSLQEGFTYAEYARRGFFELLLVTMLNLSIIICILTFVKHQRIIMTFIRVLLTLLILFSGVMLSSAFLRLFLYEEAYGFTLARVLPHTFMVFLMIIFAYTLLKVWMDRLSLLHFYFITAVIYYTLLNVVNIDQFIVEQNLNRYEKTAKIDVYYLNGLSYSGLSGLIDLYETNPSIPMLKDILKERQAEERLSSQTWQSYNFSKNKVLDRLEKLSLNGM